MDNGVGAMLGLGSHGGRVLSRMSYMQEILSHVSCASHHKMKKKANNENEMAK